MLASRPFPRTSQPAIARDTERSVAPLKAAPDARILDSTHLSPEEVTRRILDWACAGWRGLGTHWGSVQDGLIICEKTRRPRWPGRLFEIKDPLGGGLLTMSESFAELLEESLANQQIKPGAIITGTVVDVNDDVVIVHAGLKSEAVIPVNQFMDEHGHLEVEVGDEVEVALDAVEDGYGETRLSREKAKRARTWVRLEKAYEGSEIVNGIISGRVKGGFTVDIELVRAFLPGSLVDVRPVRDPVGYLEGKPLEFKVIKLDQKRNNVVVSRRAVVEDEYSAEREELLKNLQEGAQCSEGRGQEPHRLRRIRRPRAASMDLLHITDMAWKRVKHPSEVVTRGPGARGSSVLKFDRERNRVSLGLKQLGADPLEAILRAVIRRTPDCSARSRTSRITVASWRSKKASKDLVHVSEMDWTNKNVNPHKVVQIGDEARDHGPRHRRGAAPHFVSGIKQCKSNPWAEFAANYKKGDKVYGPNQSRLPTSVSSSGCRAVSMAWCICRIISWDLTPGEEAVRNYHQGRGARDR